MTKKIANGIKREEIKFWIPILISIIGAALAWGGLIAKVNNNTRSCEVIAAEVAEQKARCQHNHEKLDESLLKIEVKLAEIQKDIEYIKKKVNN